MRKETTRFGKNTKQAWLGACMLFLLLVSLFFMSVDHKSGKVDSVRQVLSVLLLPIQYAVDKPVTFIKSIEENFIDRKRLIEENNALKQKQLILSARLQRSLAIEKENHQLKTLLDAAKTIKPKTTTAQLLSVSGSPFSQQLLINKGSKQGVYVGQPVLDSNGVIGQVIKTSPLNSRVLLLTDSLSAIPVQVNRSGLRGIAVGLGDSIHLQLIHMSDSTELKLGDVLVTSGLGRQFPFGYPVGVVVSFKQSPLGHFTEILLKPLAQINRSRQLLLVNLKKGQS